MPALTPSVRENCQYVIGSTVQVATIANFCEVVAKNCEMAASQNECQGKPAFCNIMKETVLVRDTRRDL